MNKTNVLAGLGIITACVVGLIVSTLNSPDHRAFVDFSARRDAWDARCLAFRNVPLKSDPRAQACNDDLNALVAEGVHHGWIR